MVGGGWSVFPCLPDKRPATEHGFHDASREPDQVRQWFGPHPEWLLAVPTQGHLVVDLDYRPGRDVCGGCTWKDIALAHGWSWEDTLLVGTPSGGLHIWYRQPAGAKLRNTAGLLGPGIDTRADGGYVIVPPSVTPTGPYEFIPGCSPMVGLPTWLLDALAPKVTPAPVTTATPLAKNAAERYGLRALEGELGRLAQAPEGQRNDQLNRSSYAVGQLIGAGVVDSYHAAEQLLSVAVRTGLGVKEATATVRSGIDSGVRHPRDIQ